MATSLGVVQLFLSLTALSVLGVTHPVQSLTPPKMCASEDRNFYSECPAPTRCLWKGSGAPCIAGNWTLSVYLAIPSPQTLILPQRYAGYDNVIVPPKNTLVSPHLKQSLCLLESLKA